jgi:hypothetical protein
MSFIESFRQRRIVQSALAYLASAWLILAGLPIGTAEGHREAVWHRDVPDETCRSGGGKRRVGRAARPRRGEGAQRPNHPRSA